MQISQGWRYADLYYEQNGLVSVLRSGTFLPPQRRAFASHFLVFALPLEADREVTFYLHLVGDTSRYGDARVIGGTIQRLDVNQSIRRDILFGQGIYGGIILALVLYNLILFAAISERAYLYYSLYVLTFGSVWTARTGFLYQYLWPNHPVLESESPVLPGCTGHHFQQRLCASVSGDARKI